MKQFLFLLAAIVATYIVQTLLKIAQVIYTEEFDWKILKQGLIEHLIYFIAIGLMFFIGYLIPDVQILTINEKAYALQDAMYVIGLALECKQAFAVATNMKAYFELDKIDVQELEQEVKG